MHLSLGDSPDPTTLTYPRDLLEIARIGRYRGPRWGGEQEQARGLVDTDSTKKTYTTQEHSCLPFHPLSSTPSGASSPR